MTSNPISLAIIQRILVAVDGSDHSLAALEAAASLAAALQAELEALFVEDIDLLRLADLPCSRVVSLLLLEAERTDRKRMERQLRVRAARARAALQQRTEALGIRTSFRSVRGKVTAEVVAAAAGSDILSLGKASHRRMRPAGGGSTLRAALTAGRPLLVVESPVPAGEGLLIVYDGSPASGRALALAGQLAAGSSQGLRLLVLASSLAQAEGLAAQARERLAGMDITASLSHSSAKPYVAILTAVRRLRPSLLLLGLEAEGEESLELAGRLLEAVNCPLLVVP